MLGLILMVNGAMPLPVGIHDSKKGEDWMLEIASVVCDQTFAWDGWIAERRGRGLFDSDIIDNTDLSVESWVMSHTQILQAPILGWWQSH